MKPKLDIITLDDVRSWKPCQPVERYRFVPPNWKGTVFDILDCEQLPLKDRLWLVVREEVMELRDVRLFALRCAKRVEHLMQDQRSKDALAVLERGLAGAAMQTEIDAAAAAAADAAWAAAWAADAARAADAAWAAAWAAARDAAWARAAAMTAECKAQIEILKDILTD